MLGGQSKWGGLHGRAVAGWQVWDTRPLWMLAKRCCAACRWLEGGRLCTLSGALAVRKGKEEGWACLNNATRRPTQGQGWQTVSRGEYGQDPQQGVPSNMFLRAALSSV